MNAHQWIRHSIFIALGVAIIVALIVFGILRKNAQSPKTLMRAAENFAAAQSFHTTSQLDINLPLTLRGVERPFTKITTKIEGDVQRTEDGTPQLSGTLFMEARGRGNIFFADGQIRILDDRVAFNLNNLPVFLNPSGSLVKKWTYVDTGLLRTHNTGDIRTALLDAFRVFEYRGQDSINGQSVNRFSATLSEEQERNLADAFRAGSSNNQGLHVIARLLDAQNTKTVEMWVDPQRRQLRRVRATFVRPMPDGSEFEFATLDVTVSDYGKQVAIDEPPRQTHVRPDVFARLFGTGQVEKVQD